MKFKTRRLVFVTLSLLMGGFALSLVDVKTDTPISTGSAWTGNSNVKNVLATYSQWKDTLVANGIHQKLILPLHYSKARSSQFTKAHGHATINLLDGSLTVEVQSLSTQRTYDVWLIDNRTSTTHTVKLEGQDGKLNVGTLEHQGETAYLHTQLSSKISGEFQLNLLLIAPTGTDPEIATLLVGSPSLFQRLYFSSRSELVPQLVKLSQPENSMVLESTPARLSFAALVPAPAYAKEFSPEEDALHALVARGAYLFFNETFEGNGRTCGTCHRATNNFTIDPAFIATLPPDDPLFVAEFNPDLAELEIPRLMRQFGLILENIDGFEDPTNKFVMRGVPHTLALTTSITSGATEPPLQATGWSGDGAPNDGTLRDFATGAVTQHFTKTLNRQEDIDFRLPTEGELDALEAFQLSLGRQSNPDLETLQLKGAVPQRGQQIFLCDGGTQFGDECVDDEGGFVAAGKCNLCHLNAGASSAFAPGINFNFNTAVERLPDQPARLVQDFPCDGGLGKEFNPDCGVGGDGTGFGDGTFNTPPLIEAADSGPFFHNNAIMTIEGAVDFYNSDVFNNTGLVNGINLEPTEVESVAAFLRVLNALENIRSSIEADERALRLLYADHEKPLDHLLRFSRAEIVDAIKDLLPVHLHVEAAQHLKTARTLIKEAAETPRREKQIVLITLAIKQQLAAKDLMVERS